MNYRNDLSVYSSIDGNFRGGGGAQNIRGFHGWISALSTNILPMNEAILTTFTCSASSNHENKPQMFWRPENYPLYGTVFNIHLNAYVTSSSALRVLGSMAMCWWWE